jgi:hypothetical protein
LGCRGSGVPGCTWRPALRLMASLYPTPHIPQSTLHHTACTLHPANPASRATYAPCTLPTPYTLHPPSPHPTPYVGVGWSVGGGFGGRTRERSSRSILLATTIHFEFLVDGVGVRVFEFMGYRGTSLIRKCLPVGSYSRAVPRALWWS